MSKEYIDKAALIEHLNALGFEQAVKNFENFPTVDADEGLIRYDAVSNDTVNHPSHYTQGGIECIEAIKAATVGLEGIEAVCTGNAIKYLWRWKQKNGAEDLKKAIWYIERLIKEAGK